MFDQYADDLRFFMLRTYSDSCLVQRSIDSVQSNHTTQRQFVTLYSDLPCRLSRMTTRRAVFSENMPQTQIQSDAKLYIDFGVDIQPGDRFIIQHLQEHLEYECGDVYAYSSHTECFLKKVVGA